MLPVDLLMLIRVQCSENIKSVDIVGFQRVITGCNKTTTIMPGNEDRGDKSPGLKKALKFAGYTISQVGIPSPSSDFRYYLLTSSNSQANTTETGI